MKTLPLLSLVLLTTFATSFCMESEKPRSNTLTVPKLTIPPKASRPAKEQSNDDQEDTKEIKPRRRFTHPRVTIAEGDPRKDSLKQPLDPKEVLRNKMLQEIRDAAKKKTIDSE